MANKKIYGIIAILIIAILLISFSPIHYNKNIKETPGQTEGNRIIPDNTQVLQGKITDTGILYIVLEKEPLTNKYGELQKTINDPNLEVMLYNPNPTEKVKMSLDINNRTQNYSITASQDQITQYQFTAPLTIQKGNISIVIGNTGYYNIPEELKLPSPIPFYNMGELSEFAFLTIMTAFISLLSFGIALAILRKTKYFPPVKAPILMFLIVAILGYIFIQYTTNYYSFIETPWYNLEMPLIFIMTLIFLSYIPKNIKRGILIKFLDERQNGEAYTDILPILVSESEPLKEEEIPEHWKDGNMEYIDKNSYMSFLRRLIGFKTHIIFYEGKFPDQLAQPKIIKPSRQLRKLSKLINRKRTQRGYDFGYLIAGKHEVDELNEQIEEEIKEEKIALKPDRRIFKKWRRYFKIPLSGHHSSYIEEFLAGIRDRREEGQRIEDYKEEIAKLKAQIFSGTYLNDYNIINKLGEVLNITKKPEEPKKQKENNPEIEYKEDKKEVEKK